MFNNPMNIINFLRQGGNPQYMMQMLAQQNPQMAQMLQGVDMNNPQAMEQLCRNVCMQKGLDFDTMLAQFQQQNGKMR